MNFDENTTQAERLDYYREEHKRLSDKVAELENQNTTQRYRFYIALQRIANAATYPVDRRIDSAGYGVRPEKDLRYATHELMTLLRAMTIPGAESAGIISVPHRQLGKSQLVKGMLARHIILIIGEVMDQLKHRAKIWNFDKLQIDAMVAIVMADAVEIVEKHVLEKNE